MQYKWFITAMSAGLAALLMLVIACGGDDDGGEGDVSGDNGPTATLDGGDEGGDDSGDDGDDDAGDDSGDDSSDDGSGDDDGGDDGDGGGDDDFTGEVNPCDLLTPDEVSAALGEPVTEGETEDFDPFFSCGWESETLSVVSVSVYADDRDSIESYFELGNEESEEVDGLGDKAYWNETFNDLEILSGNYDVSISVFGGQDTDNRAVATELAPMVLERLP